MFSVFERKVFPEFIIYPISSFDYFVNSKGIRKTFKYFRKCVNSELSSGMMMEGARTSETSVDNYFTRQYIPQDNSELHTRRRDNLKSLIAFT
jgi:hypothetical protein